MDSATAERYVDAAAAALDLPIAEAHREGVVHYFQLAAGMAELVFAQPLHVDDDAAEAFVPVEPTDARLLAERKRLR